MAIQKPIITYKDYGSELPIITFKTPVDDVMKQKDMFSVSAPLSLQIPPLPLLLPLPPLPPPPILLSPVQSKIDLRYYGEQGINGSLASGKQLIIKVILQLIEKTDTIVKNSIGTEKQKHQFRLSQFRKALGAIKTYPNEIVNGTQAQQLKGIGKGIGARIDEILETGTLAELSKVDVFDVKTKLIHELMTVSGVGEANAKKMIEQGVTSLVDLQDKVAKGVIRLTHHPHLGLFYYQDFQQKIPFQEIVEIGKIMRNFILEIYPDVKIEICGSYRRQRLFSGDIDVLMTHQGIVTENDLIESQIHYLKNIVLVLKKAKFIVDDLTSQGDTKYMGVCRHPTVSIGRRIDIRFVTYDSFFPALVYFTGSMTLNRLMRTIALEKGYTLNEYGLYRANENSKVMINSERELFGMLNLVYLEPSEREIL